MDRRAFPSAVTVSHKCGVRTSSFHTRAAAVPERAVFFLLTQDQSLATSLGETPCH